MFDYIIIFCLITALTVMLIFIPIDLLLYCLTEKEIFNKIYKRLLFIFLLLFGCVFLFLPMIYFVFFIIVFYWWDKFCEKYIK